MDQRENHDGATGVILGCLLFLILLLVAGGVVMWIGYQRQSAARALEAERLARQIAEADRRRAEAAANAAANGRLQVEPMFSLVAVFIVNQREDNRSRCTTTFTPTIRSSSNGGQQSLTCGYPGAVSKVTWEYLGTDDRGDRFRFQRIFPFDRPEAATEVKEVIYTGGREVVFEDEHQQIGLQKAQSGAEAPDAGPSS